jgi:hypothetical protein
MELSDVNVPIGSFSGATHVTFNFPWPITYAVLSGLPAADGSAVYTSDSNSSCSAGSSSGAFCYRVNGAWAAGGSGGGTGTVTHTVGALASLYLVLGNGGADVETSSTAFMDGSNVLNNSAGFKSTGAGSGTLQLGGSSSGTTTITVAAAAGTYTLTLPATAGTTGYALFDSDGAGTATWSNDGSALVPKVTLSAATPATVAGSGYWLNNTASVWTANLPAVTSATVGSQYCVGNAAARASAVTIQLPASTYMYYQGVIGSSAGTLVSSGAAGDLVCVVAIDTTHYQALGAGNGTWTNH